MLDYGEALDYYLEAYKIALRELDDPFEMIVLNNIAILYSKEKQFDKAEEFFDKAFVLAHENKDSVKIGFYAINLATVANEQKETSKAEFYTKIAEQHLAQNPQFSFYIPLTKAQTFLLQKDYTKVHQEIDKIFPKLKTVEMTKHRINAFLILSDAFMGQNNNQKAEEFLTKARLVKPQTIENKINIFDRMVNLNRNLNRFDLAFAYKDSVMLAKDSLHIIKNGKQFENSKIKFELQNQQKKLKDSLLTIQKERKIYYSTIFGVILFLLLGFWAVRNYFTKLKQRKTIAENDQKIMALELEQEKNLKLILEQQLNEQSALQQLEIERHKNEIEAKNRQLASKALSISTRNEFIEKVILALENESSPLPNTSLQKRISELKNHLKKETSWDDFLTHFEEVNSHFIQSLKQNHSDLNQNDIRFLSYIYMNLKTKEISSLFNITIEACRKRKERIIKKMNLSDDIDLYHYLSSL